jgi:hypothetical protein
VFLRAEQRSTQESVPCGQDTESVISTFLDFSLRVHFSPSRTSSEAGLLLVRELGTRLRFV